MSQPTLDRDSMRVWPLRPPTEPFASYRALHVGRFGFYRGQWHGAARLHVGPLCFRREHNGTYLACPVCRGWRR